MSNELVKVTLTPQGTADVYIGELHIKTFGGKEAHQAAADFAQQIKMQLAQPLAAFIKDKQEITVQTSEPECEQCYDEFGSFSCIRPAHKDKQNAKTRTEGKQSG